MPDAEALAILSRFPTMNLACALSLTGIRTEFGFYTTERIEEQHVCIFYVIKAGNS